MKLARKSGLWHLSQISESSVCGSGVVEEWRGVELCGEKKRKKRKEKKRERKHNNNTKVKRYSLQNSEIIKIESIKSSYQSTKLSCQLSSHLIFIYFDHRKL